MAIFHACNFPTWVIVYNILPCSACAGPANGDGSGESRLHGEERGGDVGKNLLTNFHMHACMHIFPKWETQAHMACMYILLQASDEKDESAKEAVEESPRFIFMHVSFVKSC